MRLLFLGDIVGRAGRTVVCDALPNLINRHSIDFVIINAFVIPLEERELVDRFGEEYRGYQKRVPRLFPHGPVVRRH